jgi:hypothetical protein
MLRVSCSCGRVLKLNDDLAGKKIKCPDCASVLTVKTAASAGVSTKPTKAPVDDDDAVASGPAPARNKTGANGAGAGKSLPRPRKVIRDEDDDDRPRKKKGAPVLLLALLGGGALLFLGFIGVAIAAYFIFFRSSSDTPTAKGPDKGSPQAKMDPVAIKLFVPNWTGSVREVKENTQQIVGPITAFKEDMKMTLRVLGTDKQGHETKTEITLDDYAISGPQAMLRNANVYKTGNVLVRQLTPSGTYAMFVKQGDKLTKVPPGPADSDMEVNNDALFGTKDKKAVGDTWPANVEEVTKVLNQILTPLSVAKENGSGTVKFAKAGEEGGKRYYEFEATATLAIKNVGAGPLGAVEFTWQARYPADFSTGATKETVKFAVEVEPGEGPNPGKKGGPITQRIDTTIVTETKYLKPGDPNAPPFTGQGEDVAGKDGYKVNITSASAVRTQGSGYTADLEFKFNVAGQPPPGAGVLYFYAASIDPSGKAGPPLRLHSQKMDMTNQDGTIKVPIPIGKADGAVEIWVTTGGAFEKRIASLSNIKINLPKKTDPGTDAFTVTLLGTPKVEWIQKTIGQFQRFTVELSYTTAGKAGIIDQLEFYIDFKGKDGKKKSVLFGTRPPQGLKASDTLSFEQGVDLADLAATNTCDIVVVYTPNGKSPQVLDTKLNVPISGSPVPSSVPVVVTISNVKVEQRQGKKVYVSFEYNFTKGKPDPSSTYRTFCNVKGGKPAVLDLGGLKGDKVPNGQGGFWDNTVDGELPAGAPFEIYMKEFAAKGVPDGVQVTQAPNVKGKVTSVADPLQVAVTGAKIVITKKEKNGNLHVQLAVSYKAQGTAKAGAQYECKVVLGLPNNQTRELKIGNNINAAQFVGMGAGQFQQPAPHVLGAPAFAPACTVTIYEVSNGKATPIVSQQNVPLQ